MAKKPNLKVVGGPGDSSPGPGHNQMSDDQARGLHFSSHVPAYEKALAAKKKADADLKNVCKTIKSDGGSVDDVKLTIKLRTPEGEKEFKEQIERQRKIAEWNNLPIGGQGWLLDEDRRPVTDRAFEEGKKGGLEGKDASPPHALGTEAHEAWMKGWHDGQAILAQGFKKGPDSAEILRDDSKKPEAVDDFDKSASEA